MSVTTGDSFDPSDPSTAPSRDLLLAEALEAALAGRPTESVGTGRDDADVQELVRLARRLEAMAATAAPSPSFKIAAHARLMQQIAVESSRPGGVAVVNSAGTRVIPFKAPSHRVTGWAGRVAAGLIAAWVAGSAALTVSASALPGDALYGVKQAREVVALRLAADEQARARALLAQADARLEEVERLLRSGRAAEVLEVATRYDETLERVAHVAKVGGVGDAAARDSSEEQAAVVAQALEEKLTEHRAKLSSVLAAAPPQAREGLGRALEASGRGLERAAEVHRARAEDDSNGASAEAARERPGRGRGRDGEPAEGGTAATTAASPTAVADEEGRPGRAAERREERQAAEQSDDEPGRGRGRGSPEDRGGQNAPPGSAPDETDEPERRGRPAADGRSAPTPTAAPVGGETIPAEPVDRSSMDNRGRGRSGVGQAPGRELNREERGGGENRGRRP